MQKSSTSGRPGYLQTVSMVRAHRRLAMRRTTLQTKDKATRVVSVVGIILCAVYLIVVGVALAIAALANDELDPDGMLFAMMPLVAAFDIILRFSVQQTPGQMVKPYLLLPVNKYACIDAFLVEETFHPANCIHQCFFLSYSLVAILPREGFLPFFGTLLSCQVIVYILAQLYMFIRTRMRLHFGWSVLLIILGGLLVLPGWSEGEFDIEQLILFYGETGKKLAHFNPVYWAVLLLTFAALWLVNRREQFTHVMAEVSRKSQTRVKHIRRYAFFDAFGLVGKYMQLELKLILRNKHPKAQFIMCLVFVAIIYGWAMVSEGSRSVLNFWAMYGFIVFGMMLIRIMTYEGNYISLLTVKPDSMGQLLRAKYYFYVIAEVIPLLAGLVLVFTGRLSLLTHITYFIYIAGPGYFLIMQSAVLNDKTMPLDANFSTRTHNTHNETVITVIAAIAVLLLPQILLSLGNERALHAGLLLVSVPFIVLHPLWIDNIRNRWRRVRHERVGSLLASRD